MTRVSFRPALPEDSPAICELVASEEELFLLYPKGRYPLTPDQVEELIKRRLEPRVLLADGKVAGFGAFYGLKPGRSVFIGNVVVGPSQRRKGLGRKIVLHLIDQAFRTFDLPKVRISVFGHNTRALLLYGALGFKPYAVKERRDFQGTAVALLQLMLRRDAATSPLRVGRVGQASNTPGSA